MEQSLDEFYLYTSLSRKIALPVFGKLLRSFGSHAAIISQADDQLLAFGLSPRELALLRLPRISAAITDSGIRAKAEQTLEWAQQRGHHLLSFESKYYPALLREVDHPPALLYLKGDPKCLDGSQFAIVGSRKASEYGSRNAFWIANELASIGLGICSGMAMGIDTFAHRGALAAGGKTIAVQGTGLDICYPPKNVPLAAEIVAQGALISEFPLGTPPQAQNFPQRNRIISGLTIGTLVVEAAARSGSLITARLAMEQNRDVFAFPGSVANPLSKGCHRLIKEGAKLVEEPADILEELGIDTARVGVPKLDVTQSTPQSPQSPQSRQSRKIHNQDDVQEHRALRERLSNSEIRVIEIIGEENCLMQTLQDQTGLGIPTLNALLLRLEMHGIVEAKGGRFRCTSPIVLHRLTE